MKVARHILAQAIAERTLHVHDSKQLAREIAAYLLAERRVNELGSIMRDIMQYRADHGVVEAQIVTAHDARDDVLKDVEHLLKQSYPRAKSVRVSSRQDESIIGGVRIDMANTQLDLSVANKLATFKRLTSRERQ